MKKGNEILAWFDVLMWFYLGLNLILGIFTAINPAIVAGPGHTVLEVKICAVGIYLLKVLAAAVLLNEKGEIGLILLILACLFNTWLEWPFFWANLTTKLLIFDWGILATASYFLFIARKKLLS